MTSSLDEMTSSLYKMTSSLGEMTSFQLLSLVADSSFIRGTPFFHPGKILLCHGRPWDLHKARAISAQGLRAFPLAVTKARSSKSDFRLLLDTGSAIIRLVSRKAILGTWIFDIGGSR